MTHSRITFLFLFGSLVGSCFAEQSTVTSSAEARFETAAFKQFLEAQCLDCHEGTAGEAGLALDELLLEDVGGNSAAWEKVVRKLVSRQMPPKEIPRPEERTYKAVVSWLESSLDRAASQHPNPGRTETFRRLTRTEYQNAIRDLLALDVDVTELLPADESSHGFDNITVTGLSPALLDRYISAAQKISRLAVGKTQKTPSAKMYRIRPDITQDSHIAGTPIGTRGGTVIQHNFAQSGEYEIQVWLMRDRNEEVESLREAHQLEVLLDRERIELFTVKPPPRGSSDRLVDANLKTRLNVSAGPHNLGVAFLKQSSSLLETTRQPLNVHFNFYRHPRIGPAVYQVSISGPFEATSADTTPSRQRIFICEPTSPDAEEDCAESILTNLTRQAFRRPVDREDLRTPMEFFRQGRAEGGFEAGVEKALSSVLVNPQFLFKIERDPAGVPPDTAYHIGQLELASRLSFFLWSSLPDDELLGLAIEGRLSQADVLAAQVRRMLADDRSQSLVSNFAGQWLYLRNLDSVIPNMRLYPDFDDNLRQAFRQETELFFESILRDDRSVLDLIKADYTYLNERLAKHYGIPHIYGSRFRRVAVDENSRRGGLLRHASILTVTSYATRTSPVIRGHWVLKNLLGTPPPPPPPNVPALEETTVSASLPVRERLEQHRANETCAACHDLIDPVGFALDNFDAVGRWRMSEAGQPLDVSGSLPDGSTFTGVSGLEQALLDRPELFVQTLTEKLLTYAVGRGVEYYDAPDVRRIVREAKDHNYRFSQLILGIVNSGPFQMRRAQ
jgi:hypothetical protein